MINIKCKLVATISGQQRVDWLLSCEGLHTIPRRPKQQGMHKQNMLLTHMYQIRKQQLFLRIIKLKTLEIFQVNAYEGLLSLSEISFNLITF